MFIFEETRGIRNECEMIVNLKQKNEKNSCLIFIHHT